MTDVFTPRREVLPPARKKLWLLLATKVKTILQRAEAKDYRDIAALLQAGGDLATGLGAARTLFGPNFQPGEALKALAILRTGICLRWIRETRPC